MFSRREFLGTVAAGAAMSAAHGADREHLREFAYSDVRLTGGPLTAQYDWVHAHFLSLENDRLLKVYRQRAGLPAPGEDMGGWYDADGFVPGHTIGQYISGLSRMYATTGDPQWLAMARLYLLDKEYFDPLAQGRNLLPGKHAYSHVIALSSAAKAYEVLGDAKYLNAIRNAWDMLEETQQFASGGWGPKEAFGPPHEGKVGDSLTAHREHFETPCGCYAHMKLARYLLRFTGDPRYGDGLERVLYNTILGSIEPSVDGDYSYYSYYQPAAKNAYSKKN